MESMIFRDSEKHILLNIVMITQNRKHCKLKWLLAWEVIGNNSCLHENNYPRLNRLLSQVCNTINLKVI